jgi:hypothetical protein
VSARAGGGCTNNFVYHNLKQHIPELLDLCTVQELVIVYIRVGSFAYPSWWLCIPKCCAYIKAGVYAYQSKGFVVLYTRDVDRVYEGQ